MRYARPKLDGLILPILSGPLRGATWVLSSSIPTCWLGTYERNVLAEMVRFLKKGDIFYDIGAQAGYHSILAARCVGQTGRVFAFEALERNQRYMVRNFALNRLTNAEVVCAAVSDASGRGNFEPNPGFMAGHLSDSGSLIVDCITLDSWVESGHPPPTFLKIDAEGSELRVLHGAKMTLEHNLPVVFLDTHDFLGGACKGIHRECLEFLRRSGYNIVKSSRSSRFADRISAWP